MRTIETPDGTMHESGFVRRLVAGFVDFCAAAFILYTIALVIQTILGVVFGTDASMILSISVAAGCVLYLILRAFVRLPSVGDWALALRRYSFSEIEGFNGKGSVVCIEPLLDKTMTRRTLIVASAYGGFMLLFWFYASVFAN
jgi:hypothetical protein